MTNKNSGVQMKFKKMGCIHILSQNRDCKWQQTNVISNVLTKEPATSRKS